MREYVLGYGLSPFVPVAFTVDVEVVRPQLLTVGISMRRATEVKAGKCHNLSSAILIAPLAEVDPSAVEIKTKVLSPIR